jgi:hypothetical protein
LALTALAGSAQQAPSAPPASASPTSIAGGADPFFLGYGTEPGMEFGGRTVASIQSLVARSFSRIDDVGSRHPGQAPAWEFPVAALLILVQHEVDGHGGRGREFGLSPSYHFNFDFSGATNLAKSPRTDEQGSLLAAGGTEADGVMAHGILLDAMRPEGVDAAKIPLALISKLDLTLYVAQTSRPTRGNDFGKQYHDGNDMAFYLVSRQATRQGESSNDVWNGDFAIDFDDRLLQDNYDDMRATALWNLLDPSLAAALYGYFHDHVLGGAARVRPPMLRVGDGLALTLGTRGFLGPQEVSRFLDLHAACRHGVATLYVRDLDSSTDRAYGYGLGLHGVPIGSYATLGLAGDAWKEPAAREGLRSGNGWNAAAELGLRFERWGLALKGGSKSAGFFPGLPLAKGSYVGFGASVQLAGASH